METGQDSLMGRGHRAGGRWHRGVRGLHQDDAGAPVGRDHRPRAAQKYSFGVETHSDWTPGSEYTAGVPGVVDIAAGKNVEVDPPRLLVQTFDALWSDEVKAQGTTRVTWEIAPVGTSCRLTVTHDQLPAHANPELYGGWPMILSGLKTLLETGEPLDTPGSLRCADGASTGSRAGIGRLTTRPKPGRKRSGRMLCTRATDRRSRAGLRRQGSSAFGGLLLGRVALPLPTGESGRGRGLRLALGLARRRLGRGRAGLLGVDQARPVRRTSPSDLPSSGWMNCSRSIVSRRSRISKVRLEVLLVFPRAPRGRPGGPRGRAPDLASISRPRRRSSRARWRSRGRGPGCRWSSPNTRGPSFSDMPKRMTICLAVGDLLEVVRRTGRDLAEDELLGDTATERHRHLTISSARV